MLETALKAGYIQLVQSRPEPHPALNIQVTLLSEEGVAAAREKPLSSFILWLPLAAHGAQEQGWALWSKAGELGVTSPSHPCYVLHCTTSTSPQAPLLPQPDEENCMEVL